MVGLTAKEAADRIRYWARLNYTPEIMAYHQFMALANELDPKEGNQSGPADPGSDNGVIP